MPSVFAVFSQVSHPSSFIPRPPVRLPPPARRCVSRNAGGERLRRSRSRRHRRSHARCGLDRRERRRRRAREHCVGGWPASVRPRRDRFRPLPYGLREPECRSPSGARGLPARQTRRSGERCRALFPQLQPV
ncbi:hypothetical protein AMJ85_11770 [candidate division BRC1 bacterium SM23_51]|nr:MAG: hypothetical protein AMJ85_11770 [candidate division BRC1 bacterium SM23_51]